MDILGSMMSLFVGENGGLRKSELSRMTRRNQASKYFPYIAYDADKKLYNNNDNTVGFIWECYPLVYASEKTFENLEGLFNMGVPEGSVLQFMLWADPFVDLILDEYQNMRPQDASPVVKKITEATRKMFQEGTHGLKKIQNIPVRNFRLIVSLKVPQETKNIMQALELRDNIKECLHGLHLYPQYMEPEALINLLSKMFNDRTVKWESCADSMPINKQILSSETKITVKWNEVLVGDKHLRCITPKKLPSSIDCMTSNMLTGDVWGLKGDGNQINCPFAITVNVLFEKLNAKLHGKCNFVLQQKAVGSLAPSLHRKQEEYMWATGELEKGRTPFVRIMPIIWTFCDDEDSSRENTARAKRLWENQGFVMQEDRGILGILLYSSLPFGLYNIGTNISMIDRDFILDGKSAARFLPIQGDFSGGGSPSLLMVGRKGQIATIDIFSKRSLNYNCMVAATTGSGKSFFTNYLLFNNYATGARIRIIDLGRSYEKTCDVVAGKYIAFTEKSEIIINPFGNVSNIKEDIGILSSVVAQMIYSSTRQQPVELQMGLIKSAIRHTYETKGNDGQIDDVQEYLRNADKYLAKLGIKAEMLRDMGKLGEELAYNLSDYTSSGVYGRWFNGKSNLDIKGDDFVALELEELKPQTELFRVVTLQLINFLTNELYLSARDRKRMFVFDEPAQFLGDDESESVMIAKAVASGYRRARKYKGSFTCVFQSILDLALFRSVGQVIKANSAFKFLLESEDYPEAAKEKIISYDPFTMEILRSVKTPKPRYSEIFLHSPMGTGVVRLVTDPESYWIYTSDPDDNAKLKDLQRKGIGYDKACEILAGTH